MSIMTGADDQVSLVWFNPCKIIESGGNLFWCSCYTAYDNSYRSIFSLVHNSWIHWSQAQLEASCLCPLICHEEKCEVKTSSMFFPSWEDLVNPVLVILTFQVIKLSGMTQWHQWRTTPKSEFNLHALTLLTVNMICVIEFLPLRNPYPF